MDKAYIIIPALILGLVILGLFYKKSKGFFKSACMGVLSLAVVNISSVITGIGITISLASVLTTTVLGLPGVVLILIIRTL